MGSGSPFSRTKKTTTLSQSWNGEVRIKAHSWARMAKSKSKPESNSESAASFENWCSHMDALNSIKCRQSFSDFYLKKEHFKTVLFTSISQQHSITCESIVLNPGKHTEVLDIGTPIIPNIIQFTQFAMLCWGRTLLVRLLHYQTFFLLFLRCLSSSLPTSICPSFFHILPLLFR